MSPEQAELVERLRLRDEDAFADLVREYQDRVVNIVYRMLHNYEDAVDVAQEAFLKAFRSIDSFKGQSQIYTWLCRIAMNTASSLRRSKRWQMEESTKSLDSPLEGKNGPISREPAGDGPNPSKNAERREIETVLLSAIDGLDDEFRSVVVLKDIEGFGYNEISQILEIPRGTVKSRLHRARLLLRESLKGLV
ncbi:MAG: sigma-70 family RNA polymerase sigma factor [Planctomycetota bacterium]|jgi:RNA polymerase sigma-70 factor (ECF subfamily)